MKIIFSRKGFDSEYGGCASPIFSNGRFLSLPIPTHSRSPTRYNDLNGEADVSALVEQLSSGRVRSQELCHLDPDLSPSMLPRSEGWMPAFGQTGRAQSHLTKQKIGPGDLFLFFGWFRAVERNRNAIWRYKEDATNVHQIFGWLQVGQVIRLGSEPGRSAGDWPALAQHPHFYGSWDENNTLYVATSSLEIDGLRRTFPGGGVFKKAYSHLKLTAPGSKKRTEWQLPSLFHPRSGETVLTYHGNLERWERRGQYTRLRTVARGQEFVFDVSRSQEAAQWLASIFDSC